MYLAKIAVCVDGEADVDSQNSRQQKKSSEIRRSCIERLELSPEAFYGGVISHISPMELPSMTESLRSDFDINNGEGGWGRDGTCMDGKSSGYYHASSTRYRSCTVHSRRSWTGPRSWL